ncbi:conserved hypothetical protein [Ricinus communis]|uniref:Uncharacterized protein n=1 Tax=Ricinus communis TaxID=3988 RepID=B9TDK2_RICCO|nr:conserved hypothetical protein [Ricinus communis]
MLRRIATAARNSAALAKRSRRGAASNASTISRSRWAMFAAVSRPRSRHRFRVSPSSTSACAASADSAKPRP